MTEPQSNAQLKNNREYGLLLLYFILLYAGVYTIYICHIETKSFLPKVCGILVAGSLFNLMLPLRIRVYLPSLLFVGCCYLFLHIKMFEKSMALLAVMLVILIPNYNFRLKVLFTVAVVVLVSWWRITPFYLHHPKLWFNASSVIGCIFMLRTVSYLYELSINGNKVPVIQRINYFLIPSNISLPVFPLIDYKVFTSSYYSRPALETFRRGTEWVLLGTVQYLFYKVLYYNFAVSPVGIASVSELLQFLVVQFLYVLRILGLFHISLGLICLYGYHLPDVFNHLFVATGFTDLWNRINIYWKDFVVKVFFYPIYFKIRKSAVPLKMFLVTMVCFFISWQLHSWQWFWIRGNFPFDLVDAVFWISFGVLVAIEAEIQNRAVPKIVTPNLGTVALKAFKSVGVLLVMCLLWSIWVSPDLASWSSLFADIEFSTHDTAIVLASLSVWYAGVFIYHWLYINKQSLFTDNRPWGIYVFLLVALVLHTRLMLFVESALPVDIQQIKTTKPNRVDKEFAERSYYDNLLSGKDFLSDRSNENNETNKWSVAVYPRVTTKSNSVLGVEFLPNQHLEHQGEVFETNKWGMRDKYYPKAKPDSVYRIALIGGSYEMGQGVSNDDIFEKLTEDKLNQSELYDASGKKVTIEILNFSVEGYRTNKVLPVLELKAQHFSPDAVVFFKYTDDNRRLVSKMAQKILQNTGMRSDSFLMPLFKDVKIHERMTEKKLNAVLKDEYENMNQFYSSKIQGFCQIQNIAPILAFLPVLNDSINAEEHAYLKNLAHQHNFEFADFSNVYGNERHAKLALSDTDIHPNRRGHKLIANRFYELLLQHLKSKGITQKSNEAVTE